MSTTHDHDTTIGSGAAAGDAGTSSLDGFRALNPSDGLFLRAEHLSVMQSYAQSLAFATATATGIGVVHGLGVRWSQDGDNALYVSPGLAISPTGRLLRLGHTLKVPLDEQDLAPRLTNGFWVVELHWASGSSGSAPVYGSLCNDACADGGSTIRPWRDEGVVVRLTPDTLPGLDATPSDVRRNWLASAYFERERAAGPPWLVPAGSAGRVEPLYTRSWDDATALPADRGVALAVLQDVDGEKVLDVWTARRLVDGANAHAAWRSRLAMRPWSVFLAQMLQFEEELSVGGSPLGLGSVDPGKLVVLDVEVEEELREPIERYMREMADKFPSRWHQFTELKEAVLAAAVQKRGRLTAVRSLEGLGLRELPSAGYLAVDETQDGLLGVLGEFFGARVDLRLRPVRADQVAGALADAQHRDRIPLDSDLGHPQVDVLVPVQPADTPELRVDAYGWVAFVRRPLECVAEAPDPPEEKSEDVTVYSAFSERGEPEDEFREGRLEGVQEIGRLAYPAGGWDYPGGDVARKAAEAAATEDLMVIVALASDPDRAPLAALRASLFAASLDAGLGAPPVHAFPSATGEEAIVLVFLAELT